MNILPLNDRVLLRKVKEGDAPTKSGLILPSTMPKQDRYEIVALSNYADIGLFKEGDTVYIEKYSGAEITIDDEALLLVKIENILAVEVSDEGEN